MEAKLSGSTAKVWPRKTRLFLSLLGVGLVAIASTLIAVSLQIGAEVDDAVHEAMQIYPGDKVEALLATVNCGTCDLNQRNRAVWALGRLGDPRALDDLQKYHTGEACDHQRQLCQRELGKAVSLLEGSRYTRY